MRTPTWCQSWMGSGSCPAPPTSSCTRSQVRCPPREALAALLGAGTGTGSPLGPQSCTGSSTGTAPGDTCSGAASHALFFIFFSFLPPQRPAKRSSKSPPWRQELSCWRHRRSTRFGTLPCSVPASCPSLVGRLRCKPALPLWWDGDGLAAPAGARAAPAVPGLPLAGEHPPRAALPCRRRARRQTSTCGRSRTRSCSRRR